MSEIFGEDYYERGPEKGLSCYVNYRWLPEKTIPAAMTYVDYLGIGRGESVLDFGCAKGFYVKALRLLHRDAWGCDISEYAVSQADDSVKPYIKVVSKAPIPFDEEFDYIIAKDVLEHMNEEDIGRFLSSAGALCRRYMLVIVPLAENGKYIIPEDELDVTHLQRKTGDEWKSLFRNNGWSIDLYSNRIVGLKDHQAVYQSGVGFFTLVPKINRVIT